MKGCSFLLVTFLLTNFLYAEGSAENNAMANDLLIEKLSRIKMNLAPKDVSHVPVSLRLADLYAERARQKSLKELSESCSVCNAGAEDRQKALTLYQNVLDRVPLDQQGRVMLQVGHLYEMNNQESLAIEFYQKLLKSNQNTTIQLESYFSLAEIYFKKRQYSLAYEHYLKVAQSVSPSKARAAYRSAWCLFKLEKLEEASRDFETILSTPELLRKSVAGQFQADEQFQEEVTRDWITVLTSQKWDQQSPQKIFKLSSEKTKIPLLTTLALELERVGKKSEALQTWEFAFENISEAGVKLQAHTHLALLNQDVNQKKAVENFEAALNLWTQSECKATRKCEEEYKQLKHFIVGWNKKEKLNPSLELIAAYQKYLEVFANEADMHLWLAQLAEQVKNWPLSQTEYQKAGLLLENNERESALLKQIEVAEKSQISSQVGLAQNFYLQNSIQKTKEFEVKYQSLRLAYEKNQYGEAFTGLRALALESKVSPTLRKQAADLAVDCLVLTKEDEKLKTTALEFSQIFKGVDSKEFVQIYQKTLLTQSAKLAETNQPALAYEALLKVDSSVAAEADRLILLKNKILLAQKLEKYAEARRLTDELLQFKNLPAADLDFAWSQKAYLAELFLDFKMAREATEKIQVKTTPEEKVKSIKLLLFSEILGEKPAKIYQDLLKKSSDENEKVQLLSRMIRNSTNPEAELLASKSKLSASPEVYSRLALELYAKKTSPVILKSVLEDKKMEQTGSGQVLRTLVWLQEFDILKKKLVAHKFETKSQNLLAKSIKERAKLIESLEASLSKAIERKDWTAQLLGLHILSQESQRFYQEILSTPLPTGLTAEEEQSYLNLLGTQAAPYQAKATDAAQKSQEFWANEDWKKSFQAAYNDETSRFYAKREIEYLSEIASEVNKKTLQEITHQQVNKPTFAEIELARNKVRENPLNLENLKSLKDLEQQSHNLAMVEYLETRMKEKQ